jgi:hypothetical protein
VSVHLSALISIETSVDVTVDSKSKSCADFTAIAPFFDVFVSRRREYFKCFESPPQIKCQGFGINCLIDLDTAPPPPRERNREGKKKEMRGYVLI